jgi:hypothetical protein
MNTKRISCVFMIASTLVLAAPAWAGKPAGQGTTARHCIAVQPAAGQEQDGDRRAAPDWYGAGTQTLAEYLRGWLRDEDKVNLDGVTDPCHLANKDSKDDAIPNDGKADIPKLLGKIDEWMALNRHQEAESEHSLEWHGQRVTFEFEGPDHKPQAYVGASRVDSNRAGGWNQRWEPLAWRQDSGETVGVLGPLHGAVEPAGQNGQHTGVDTANLQAVPEPAFGAMLLAGLAMVGLALRHRRVG